MEEKETKLEANEKKKLDRSWRNKKLKEIERYAVRVNDCGYVNATGVNNCGCVSAIVEYLSTTLHWTQLPHNRVPYGIFIILDFLKLEFHVKLKFQKLKFKQNDTLLNISQTVIKH